MRRLLASAAVAGPLAALGALLLALSVSAAGPPFPSPNPGQAVYDGPGALHPDTVAHLETEIDQIEARSGAEIAVYIQVDPTATEASNLDAARALMDQWGVGRNGFDDGLVILLGLQPDLVHGKVSLYAGSGFKSAYLNEDQLAGIIATDFVPSAVQGDLDSAMLSTVAAVDHAVSPGGRDRLQRARIIDALLGLGAAPIALLGTIGLVYFAWRRQGRDPFFLDSPSVLMAGPPADLTPPLATVVHDGASGQRSVTTALMELASSGFIAFHDVDAPVVDNEGGPSIEVMSPRPEPRKPLPRPEAYLLEVLIAMGGPLRMLDRDALGRLHEAIGDFHSLLETDAVRLGWFHERPRRAIMRWLAVGGLELLVGGVAFVPGLLLPSSGLVVLGIALGLGGGVTLAFARAMSQRTPNGAMVDGMLKAYRRTLRKTLELARSMEAVAADATVRILASTPDEAVVWGIALGLHREVAAVLERSLEDRAAGTMPGATGGVAWYPAWLGTTRGVDRGGGPLVSHGGGGLFSGSPVPNVSGMFSALGSIGSPPASSGGGGGGFSGGSSGGGGGASGSF
jgi:TPM domain/Predicted membrane protein (DUF2207) C-terminal domain